MNVFKHTEMLRNRLLLAKNIKYSHRLAPSLQQPWKAQFRRQLGSSAPSPTVLSAEAGAPKQQTHAAMAIAWNFVTQNVLKRKFSSA